MTAVKRHSRPVTPSGIFHSGGKKIYVTAVLSVVMWVDYDYIADNCSSFTHIFLLSDSKLANASLPCYLENL